MKQYLRADISFTKFLLERIEWAIKPYELFNKVKEYIEKEDKDFIQALYVFYDPITKSHLEIQKNVKCTENDIDGTETYIAHKIVVYNSFYATNIYESWFNPTNFEDRFCKDVNTFNDNFNDVLIDYYACIQNQPNLADSNRETKSFIDKLGLGDKEYFDFDNIDDFLSIILVSSFIDCPIICNSSYPNTIIRLTFEYNKNFNNLMWNCYIHNAKYNSTFKLSTNDKYDASQYFITNIIPFVEFIKLKPNDNGEYIYNEFELVSFIMNVIEIYRNIRVSKKFISEINDIVKGKRDGEPKNTFETNDFHIVLNDDESVSIYGKYKNEKLELCKFVPRQHSTKSRYKSIELYFVDTSVDDFDEEKYCYQTNWNIANILENKELDGEIKMLKEKLAIINKDKEEIETKLRSLKEKRS